ncbi:MAG: hypothetical protein LC749_01530 [Actinobacteria bacterium]|nr:hypothetical protein [Actinomycetota bacterium]
MSDPWPPPILRQRQNDLGWLALSSPEDDIHIGATGTTRQEAEESYAAHRAVWRELRQTRVTESAIDQ